MRSEKGKEVNLPVLEDNAASSLLLGLGAGSRGLPVPHLFHNVEEHLVHVLSCLGRCLHILHAPLPGPALALLLRHLAVVLQVMLVSNEYNGDVVVVGDTQNLLPEFHGGLERLRLANGEHTEEPLTTPKVVVTNLWREETEKKGVQG